jgi:hypothetical protein
VFVFFFLKLSFLAYSKKKFTRRIRRRSGKKMAGRQFDNDSIIGFQTWTDEHPARYKAVLKVLSEQVNPEDAGLRSPLSYKSSAPSLYRRFDTLFPRGVSPQYLENFIAEHLEMLARRLNPFWDKRDDDDDEIPDDEQYIQALLQFPGARWDGEYDSLTGRRIRQALGKAWPPGRREEFVFSVAATLAYEKKYAPGEIKPVLEAWWKGGELTTWDIDALRRGIASVGLSNDELEVAQLNDWVESNTSLFKANRGATAASRALPLTFDYDPWEPLS